MAATMSTSADSVRTLPQRSNQPHTQPFHSPSPSPPDSPSLSASGSSVSSFPSVASSFFFSSAAASPGPSGSVSHSGSSNRRGHVGQPEETLIIPSLILPPSVNAHLRYQGEDSEEEQRIEAAAANQQRKQKRARPTPGLRFLVLGRADDAAQALGLNVGEAAWEDEEDGLRALHVRCRDHKSSPTIFEARDPTTTMSQDRMTRDQAAVGAESEDYALDVYKDHYDYAWDHEQANDVVELVALGENPLELDIPAITTRILAPFRAVAALLAPPSATALIPPIPTTIHSTLYPGDTGGETYTPHSPLAARLALDAAEDEQDDLLRAFVAGGGAGVGMYAALLVVVREEESPARTDVASPDAPPYTTPSAASSNDKPPSTSRTNTSTSTDTDLAALAPPPPPSRADSGSAVEGVEFITTLASSQVSSQLPGSSIASSIVLPAPVSVSTSSAQAQAIPALGQAQETEDTHPSGTYIPGKLAGGIKEARETSEKALIEAIPESIRRLVPVHVLRVRGRASAAVAHGDPVFGVEEGGAAADAENDDGEREDDAGPGFEMDDDDDDFGPPHDVDVPAPPTTDEDAEPPTARPRPPHARSGTITSGKPEVSSSSRSDFITTPSATHPARTIHSASAHIHSANMPTASRNHEDVRNVPPPLPLPALRRAAAARFVSWWRARGAVGYLPAYAGGGGVYGGEMYSGKTLPVEVGREERGRGRETRRSWMDTRRGMREKAPLDLHPALDPHDNSAWYTDAYVHGAHAHAPDAPRDAQDAYPVDQSFYDDGGAGYGALADADPYAPAHAYAARARADPLHAPSVLALLGGVLRAGAGCARRLMTSPCHPYPHARPGDGASVRNAVGYSQNGRNLGAPGSEEWMTHQRRERADITGQGDAGETKGLSSKRAKGGRGAGAGWAMFVAGVVLGAVVVRVWGA
ncbi:hypothetical protein C8R43DRAFT_1001407 [Mycena crocata]|nr:hypothetical protein C8R43DRAFT_1001407 [Mycena crocata]